MKKNRTLVLVLVALLALLGTAGATATAIPESTAPNYFNYQGLLLDPATGNPVADGDYTLTFALYDHATSTNPANKLWAKTQSVSVQDGLFNLLLGDLGSSTWVDGRNLWLGITVSGESEMVPRQQLVSVPYALYAQRVGEHDHLGETWSGSDEPLVVNGSFSHSLNKAPLVVSNSYADGDGLRVLSAGRAGLYVGDAKYGLHVASADSDGVYVASPDGDGFSVSTAGDDGVGVYKAGTPSTTNGSSAHNGFEVAGAEGSGLYVGRADADGLFVYSAGMSGLYVGESDQSALYINSAGGHGLYVNSTDDDGVRINSADGDGVHVTAASGYAGYFGGNVQITGQLDAQQAVINELQVTGPAIGFFPRPAYDSGWVVMAQDQLKALTHSLGGNPDDYVIDGQCKDTAHGKGINIRAFGGDNWDFGGAGSIDHLSGWWYEQVDNNKIYIYRNEADGYCGSIRIRIWVYR